MLQNNIACGLRSLQVAIKEIGVGEAGIALAIPPIQAHLLVELTVDFHVELSAGRSIDHTLIEVEAGAQIQRPRGLRKSVRELLPHGGIDPVGGDDVAGKLGANLSRAIDAGWVEDVNGVAIAVDGLREVSFALQVGWYPARDKSLVVLADPFQIEQKKRLTLLNGPGHREAVLVACRIPSWDALTIGKEIVGIQGCAASEPPAAAVELIGTRLHQHVDHGAAVASILRGKAVVLYLEFLNYFGGRNIAEVRGGTFALFGTGGEVSVQTNLR